MAVSADNPKRIAGAACGGNAPITATGGSVAFDVAGEDVFVVPAAVCGVTVDLSRRAALRSHSCQMTSPLPDELLIGLSSRRHAVLALVCYALWRVGRSRCGAQAKEPLVAR